MYDEMVRRLRNELHELEREAVHTDTPSKRLQRLRSVEQMLPKAGRSPLLALQQPGQAQQQQQPVLLLSPMSRSTAPADVNTRQIPWGTRRYSLSHSKNRVRLSPSRTSPALTPSRPAPLQELQPALLEQEHSKAEPLQAAQNISSRLEKVRPRIRTSALTLHTHTHAISPS